MVGFHLYNARDVVLLSQPGFALRLGVKERATEPIAVGPIIPLFRSSR